MGKSAGAWPNTGWTLQAGDLQVTGGAVCNGQVLCGGPGDGRWLAVLSAFVLSLVKEVLPPGGGSVVLCCVLDPLGGQRGHQGGWSKGGGCWLWA